ncbi:YidC/Oxa1 family membrane protein insertase [Hymenobacter gelipurpurascens]|uniref:Membrane protein insertase YidC n=1 Tax=Hymenobacter gelipurpurascens TaxID=89968 RepID=A0A212U8Z2_9BACT|nr:membrane protein insertase YidC [Hymenobacter gelipurpurascens]SNC74686.1 YidC/Oxa1 family membrane protein insertase [Hymenobacter gelipurpurascens]
MDRNSAIGLFLISALLIIYLYVVPRPKPGEETKKPTTTTAAAQTAATAPVAAAPLDSAAAARTLGAFGAAGVGSAQTTELKNDNITITFSSKGGRVEAVRLNQYKTFFGKPLDLLDAQSAQIDTRFRTTDGRQVKLSDLYFRSEPQGNNAVRFVADVAGGQIEQVYTLPANSFELSYNLRFNNLASVVTQEPLTFTFVDHVRQTEQDMKQNRNHTTINRYLVSGDHTALAEASEKPEEIKVTEPLKWVAHKHDFFVAGIVADNQFQSGQLDATVNLEDSTFIKTLSSTLTIPAADVQQGKANFRFYFGPNSFNTLKEVTPGFDRNVYLGWGIFRWVNQFVVLPVFHVLEKFISSYGIIIALLVVLIKLVTWPLTYKSYESQAKMKVLKPEIDAIKEKFPEDQMKQQQETMKLYNIMGVSPMGGCIPQLLTIPILFAMFQFFPNAIELRQQPFLWAHDLSTYDDLIKLPFALPFLGSHISLFTLLMTLSTLAMTYQSNQNNPAAMQGPMKFYSYLMPLVFFFVLNSFSSGLTWYYLISNLVTLAQQAITRRFVDDTKVRAKLEANKVKNKDKKPGGFSARLQDAMKAAQEKETQTRKGGRPALDADTDGSDADSDTGASDVSPKKPRKTRRS